MAASGRSRRMDDKITAFSPSRHSFGLRTVALFEALKGVLVLLLGAGALTLLHKDLDDVADHWIDFLHLNPDGRLSGFFYKIADRTTDHSLWVLAIAALVYAIIRFTESYGLWHERAWAEWFALISGCVYLPWEIYGIARHPHPWKWGLILANVLIVLYMAKLRFRDAQREG